MPSRPSMVSKKGFEPGSAAKHFETLFGSNYVHVLDVNKINDPRLKRPDQSEYTNSKTLQTDQAILDSLPTEEFFHSVSNSHNAGQSINYYLL
jgi:hypothetical protein